MCRYESQGPSVQVGVKGYQCAGRSITGSQCAGKSITGSQCAGRSITGSQCAGMNHRVPVCR